MFVHREQVEISPLNWGRRLLLVLLGVECLTKMPPMTRKAPGIAAPCKSTRMTQWRMKVLLRWSAEDAMRAFKGIDPMLAQAHSSKAADPLALVREQLASYSAPASEQAPGTPSTVRGEMQFAFVSFTYLYQYRILFFASGGRPKPKIKAKANAPLSDVSLASKTLPEKVQALRAGLGFSLCFPFLINNHACFQFFICWARQWNQKGTWAAAVPEARGRWSTAGWCFQGKLGCRGAAHHRSDVLVVEACSWVGPRRYLYTLIWPGRTDKIQEDGKFADDLTLVTATVRPLDLTCPFHFVALCNQVSESRMSRAKLGAMVKEMRKYDPQFSSNYTYIYRYWSRTWKLPSCRGYVRWKLAGEHALSEILIVDPVPLLL